MRARDSFTTGAADLWSRVGAAQQLGASVTTAAAAAAASAAATARVTEVVSEVAGASRDALAVASDLSARTAGIMGEELSIMRGAAARRHLAQLQSEARLHEGLEKQLVAPAMRDNIRHAALMQGLAHEEKTVEQACCHAHTRTQPRSRSHARLQPRSHTHATTLTRSTCNHVAGRALAAAGVGGHPHALPARG